MIELESAIQWLSQNGGVFLAGFIVGAAAVIFMVAVKLSDLRRQGLL